MSASALAGLALLVIGESHMSLSGQLIDTLHDDLTRRGAVVTSIGACGASAEEWLKTVSKGCGAERIGKGKAVIKGRDTKTTPIDQLITKTKPDVVVVVIGDTMASYDKPVFPRTWAWQGITGLTKAIAATGKACIWVGPPYGTPGGQYHKTDARVQQMSKFLATNVAPCEYIDSTTFSKPGEWATIDGQHFNRAGYKAWGDAIGRAIADSSTAKKVKK